MADPTAVAAARDEVAAAVAALAPILEGLRDYARLNLGADTAAIVAQEIHDYERRLALLQTTLTALNALLGDDYPNLPVREVEQAVYDDLQTQADTIAAALAKFAPNMATTLGLSAGEPEPKP